MQQVKFSITRLIAIICASIFVLSGCVDDKGDSGTAASVADETVAMVVSGSVGDGPIVGAKVVVSGVSGTIIATQISDEFAQYQLNFEVPSSEFPLLVMVDDGTDLVTGAAPDFPLIAAIVTSGDAQVANLNPMGTLVVKLAQRMDNGLSAENLMAANQIVISVLNFGLDRSKFSDLIASEVTDENIANVIRTSEAFGEAIRRTRDALISIGYVIDAEQIMDALSADLIDKVLDGRGDIDVDPRITVVNNVVSAQVVLEAMVNQLKVGSVLATNAIDLSIQQVTAARPGVALTDSLGVSSDLLIQADVLLSAVMLMDSNPALPALNQAIDLVEPGQIGADLPEVLQNGTSDVLEATIQQVSVASTEDIAVINDAVRNGFDAGGGNASQGPTIDGSPATEVTVGSFYDFTPTADDVDSNTLFFVILGKPSWASFNTGTGRLSGTPASGDTGSYVGIRISVSDGVQSALLPIFDIAVSGASNRAPTIGGMPFSTVTAGTQYSFMPTASDLDNDLLSFSIVGKPVWANFDQLTGQLWGTPDAGELGSYANIRISVSDGSASAALAAFSITVDGLPNRAPTIGGSAAPSVNVGSPYSFTPIASDPDGNSLTFSISGKPSWAIFFMNTGRLTGTPTSAGSWSGIRISVSDGSASASLSAFTITVNGLSNGIPSIGGSPAPGVMVGSPYSFTPTASDPDNDALTFSITGKPNWANFDGSTGRLWGTPGIGDEGTIPGIRISVSDGFASATMAQFSITVNGPTGVVPTITGEPPTQVAVDGEYTFTPAANDPNGGALTFSIVNKPAWAAFDSVDGKLSGIPSGADSGTTTDVVISVSNGSAFTSLPTFEVTVGTGSAGGANISSTQPTQYTWGRLNTGEKVYFDRSFSFTDIPPGFVGIEYLQTGNDDKNVTAPSAISFNVGQVVTVYVGYDPQFSVLPSWLQSWTDTGIRWSASHLTFDVYSKDFPAGTVTLGGNEQGGSMYSVAVMVQDPNMSPLSITGTPIAGITAGLAYSFVPTATGGSGAVRTFSITNKPSWASFDTTTGALTGTPDAADLGTTSSVMISVSDDTASVALPVIDIAVVATAVGSATLSWTPPTENADGTALTDLAGFNVHYGTTLGRYENTVTIGNPGIASSVLDNLTAGTWFFTVTAFDETGNESSVSNIDSKTVSY